MCRMHPRISIGLPYSMYLSNTHRAFRLWKRGRQPDRYYIALQKVSRSVAAAGATLPAVGSHARRSGVGQLVAGTGKKIKFNVD